MNVTVKKLGLSIGGVLLMFLVLGLLISKLDANLQESLEIREGQGRSTSKKVIGATKDGTKITQIKDGSYEIHYEDGSWIRIKDMMNYTIYYSVGTKIVKEAGNFRLTTLNGHQVTVAADRSFVIKEDQKIIATGNSEGTVKFPDGDHSSLNSTDYLTSYLKENQLSLTNIYDAYVEEVRLFINKQ
ncbi:MAG: hypothetical protein ACLTXM_15950 [Enterococcus sp.]